MNIGHQIEGKDRSPSSKCPIHRIFDMNDVKSSNMLLTVHYDSSTTHVTPTSDHNNVSSVKLDIICDFSLLNVELDSVIDVDERVRITDSTTIVSDNVRNSTRSNGDPSNFEELVLGFLRCNAVDSETTFDIVKESEVLV